ncbi:ABC transporter permease subunit [Siminovitchia sp. FSL W7-1587]|uniref:ABC transporter permease n=1 Tax=Siminovitchia sp. FSL W7-1587 TaxID=2954699 RepID=UPI0030CF3BC3
MNIFWTLFKKEWREAWHDKKLIWMPVVLSLLAISQPITQYYMPEILDKAGNLPEGAVIQIPMPSGEEVLVGTLSQFGLIGTAIFVLGAMSLIADERNSGSLTLIMARPVHALHYIGSKWLSHALLYLLSFALSYGLAYYYTNLLFKDVALIRFIKSFAAYSIWILFALTVTLLAGTVLKKAAGIAGASLVTVAAIALSGSLFPKYMGWSPANAQDQAGSMLMTGKWADSFETMAVTSIILLACMFWASCIVFKTYESY